MTSENKTISGNSLSAKKYPILNFRREFCPLLMKRFYPFIKWNAELGNSKFFIFLNISDRSSEESVRTNNLIYGGILTLRDYLAPKDRNSKLDGAWKALNDSEILSEETKESSRLYDNFRNGKLGLDSLCVGALKDYFKTYLQDPKKEKFNNPLQAHEFLLLNYYLSVEEDYFISLPLILFGKLDGVVHIVFQRPFRKNLASRAMCKTLIRGLSTIYENLLLGWDVVGENITTLSVVREELDYVTSSEFEEKSDTNLFFKELGSRQYYLDTYEYYLKRIEQNNRAPLYLQKENRKRAIISILIDSYAHNISAHSLTIIKWWFQQRAKNLLIDQTLKVLTQEMPLEEWGSKLISYLHEKFPNSYSPKEIGQGLQYDLARLYNLLKSREENEDFKAIRDQFFPLENELAALFKFLLEKGAFWSGLTRDQQFGGEIQDLYAVLWEEFIQNPLYLGTIAYSEGVTRLNIHIRICVDEVYAEPDLYEQFYRTYHIKINESGVPLNGVLATIDLGSAQKNQIRHTFIKKGAKYDLLKQALQQCRVFFPGGVVGKHAFFTILENEIRNIKHYSEQTQRKIEEEGGLNLIISIRPGPLSYGLKNVRNPLYKIGVWLGHEAELENPKGHLIKKRFERLSRDITTPNTYEARLGGVYQDKICAAMLFNNTFSSVERQTTARDRKYYPWVRAAASQGLEKDGLTEIDLELNNRNFDKADDFLTKTPFKTGFYKKYFHLWKGEFIFHANEEQLLSLENFNRFKIVNIPSPNKEIRKKLLKEGVIRILEEKQLDASAEHDYHSWLKIWLKTDRFGIHILQGESQTAYIFFNEDQADYFQADQIEDLPENIRDKYRKYPISSLRFAHDSTILREKYRNTLSIRSNGVLREKFFPNMEFKGNLTTGAITELALYELIEVLQTKICIFDNRIANRIPADRQSSELVPKKNRIQLENKRTLLSEQLNCEIYGETIKEWEQVKSADLKQYHFIILHLDFIEHMKDSQGRRYGEEGVVDFIDEHLANKLRDNCILVITTGRGRREWRRRIEKSRHAFHTTFRPVESIIEAIEKAILKKDDVELKYNLVKLLFGS